MFELGHGICFEGVTEGNKALVEYATAGMDEKRKNEKKKLKKMLVPNFF